VLSRFSQSESPALAGLSRCRRRDSNPRHADYDPAPAVAAGYRWWDLIANGPCVSTPEAHAASCGWLWKACCPSVAHLSSPMEPAEVAYSDNPAASRASCLLRKACSRITRSPLNVNTKANPSSTAIWLAAPAPRPERPPPPCPRRRSARRGRRRSRRLRHRPPCRNRACVNPHHLEAVPRKVNLRRGQQRELKTTCAQGHPWTEEHIYVRPGNGHRMCGTCNQERSRARPAYSPPAPTATS